MTAKSFKNYIRFLDKNNLLCHGFQSVKDQSSKALATKIQSEISTSKYLNIESNKSNENENCIQSLQFKSIVQLFEHNKKQNLELIEIGKFLNPLPFHPQAIFGIGLNYKSHASETHREPPEFPMCFLKNPASVCGPNKKILLPQNASQCTQIDYEAELAVIIGKPALNVKEDEALDFVFGYCVANDVSARDQQFDKRLSGGQFNRAKSFDRFCPIGPSILLETRFLDKSDSFEIIDANNLKIKAFLNGIQVQSANTNDMIFNIRKLISFLSQDTTLLPGTIILTGTPAGVGRAKNPPRYLQPNDKIECWIENIGSLSNTV